MSITNLKLKELRNEEHFQFATDFKELVQKSDSQKLNFEALFSNFLTQYEVENEVIQKIRKSASTNELADTDNQRDKLFRGIVLGVEAAKLHFDSNKQAAAGRITILLDKLGNVARKPYNEETAAISTLVQEAREKFAEDFNTIGLMEWIDNIDASNKTFAELTSNRYGEEAKQIETNMSNARLVLDEIYRSIVERINAIMVLSPTPEHTVFVQELNVRIEKYNHILAQRKGRVK